jgi:hypothetical protein
VKDKYWRVTVVLEGNELVNIESQMLSGKADLSVEELDIIRNCGEHLIAFAHYDTSYEEGDL